MVSRDGLFSGFLSRGLERRSGLLFTFGGEGGWEVDSLA